MCVVHTKPFFHPVAIQHNQCPCRFSKPREMPLVLRTSSVVTEQRHRDTTLLVCSKQSRHCKVYEHYCCIRGVYIRRVYGVRFDACLVRKICVHVWWRIKLLVYSPTFYIPGYSYKIPGITTVLRFNVKNTHTCHY